MFTEDEKKLFEYATYSPEDSKLRIYTVDREEHLSKELYEKINAFGFKRAYRQKLWVSPMWKPERFNMLMDLMGYVDYETQSVAERSLQRAEAYQEYRDRHREDAHHLADIAEAQPEAVGHHNQSKAEKMARKIQSMRKRPVTVWDKATYWQSKTAGVIEHALYKEDAGARKRRIKKLESALRKSQKNIEEAQDHIAYWGAKTKDPSKQNIHFMRVASLDRGHYLFDGQEHKMSLRTALEKNAITFEEAKRISIGGYEEQVEYYSHWASNETLRIAYEKQMLGEQGEELAQNWEIGGTVTFRSETITISKINKSQNGRISSIQCTEDSGYYASNIPADMCNNYQAPTDAGKKKAKVSKAKRPKAPALLNRAGHHEMTQKEFSARNGTYGMCDIIKQEINGETYRTRRYFKSMKGSTFGGDHVEVTLTDKKIKEAEAQKVEAPKPEAQPADTVDTTNDEAVKA